MNHTTQEEKINRLEFLKKLGLSGASLMAVYCGVTMSSCKNETVTPAVTPNTGTTVTYDLNTYTALKTIGGYYVDTARSIVIAHTSDDKYVTVTLVCTHEGKTQIRYSGTKFSCTAHGATFDNSGKALSVASAPLTTYPTTLNGTVLSVVV